MAAASRLTPWRAQRWEANSSEKEKLPMAQAKKNAMKSRKTSRGLKKAKSVQSVKPLDASLFTACCTGTHIPSGTITVR